MSKIQQRRRQIARMSMQRKIIISSFCFVLVASGFFISINVSNISESRASVEGDYRTIASGNWEDVAIWESYDGRKWQHPGKAPDKMSNKIIIQKGTAVVINSELTLSNIHIEKGAALSMRCNVFHLQKIDAGSLMIVDGSLDLATVVMNGNGSFTLSDNANITIGSPKGISKSAISGNIQVTGNRNFSKYASYTYRSPDKQFTGNGLPLEVSTLIIDNPFELELETNLIVSSTLILKKGIVSTGTRALTLGTSTTSVGTLTRENGSVKGIFRRWMGPGAMKEVLFPLSDGKNYNALFMSANKDDYRGGAFTFSFISNNSNASSRNSGSVVIPPATAAATLFAGESGSYKVAASDGFDLSSGAIKMLSTVAINKAENKSYWQMNAKNETRNSKLEARNPELLKNNLSDIVIWPNPFKESFTMKFNLDQSDEIIAELFNATGQMMHHELIIGKDHTNEVQFNDLSSLAPGVYFLNITEAGKLIASKRVIKG